MLLLDSYWSVTRAVGFAAYLAAGTSCGVGWARARRPSRQNPEAARLALALAIIESILCLDMVFEWRLALHDFFAEIAVKHDLYGQRQSFQVALDFALVVLFLCAIGFVIRRFHARKGAVMALAGIFMSLTLFFTEIISLHEIDMGLYHSVSGVMVIAFLWLLAGTFVLLGVLVDTRSGAVAE